jgi:hypothetical protein
VKLRNRFESTVYGANTHEFVAEIRHFNPGLSNFDKIGTGRPKGDGNKTYIDGGTEFVVPLGPLGFVGLIG